MTLGQAFVLVLLIVSSLIASWWYLWCWYTILFVCYHPKEFFSSSYPSNSIFILATAALFVLLAAQILVILTN